jgi:uncharacterized phage-associated protein
MAYSANAVAEWILFLARQKGITLTHMQLQKCLYYAQGYSLGMTGEKLFDDRIEAWTHGPVVPEVYRHYKFFAGNIINPPQKAEIPEDLRALLEVIVSEKSASSASALRNATHNEIPYKDTPKGEEITEQKLKNFFVDKFWTSDEEDEYEPSFDSEEEAVNYFNDSLSEEKKKALMDACCP